MLLMHTAERCSEIGIGIRKARQSPAAEGCGKPLGNKGDANLAGLFKIKLRKSGIRVVYQLIEVDGVMRIVVVGMRADDEVYREAARRLERQPALAGRGGSAGLHEPPASTPTARMSSLTVRHARPKNDLDGAVLALPSSAARCGPGRPRT